MAIDIFQNKRIEDSLSDFKLPNMEQLYQDEERLNTYHQGYIDNVLKNTDKNNSASIERASKKLKEYHKNYNKDFDESTFIVYESARSSLREFDVANSTYEGAFNNVIGLDEKIATYLKGGGITSLPEDEFNEELRTNWHKYLKEIQQAESALFNFERQYAHKYRGGSAIAEEVETTRGKLSKWKNELNPVLLPQAGLSVQQFEMLLADPTEWQKYEQRMQAQFAQERKNWEGQIDDWVEEANNLSYELNNLEILDSKAASGAVGTTANKFEKYDDTYALKMKRAQELEGLINKGNYEWSKKFWYDSPDDIYRDFKLNLDVYDSDDVYSNIIKDLQDEDNLKEYDEDPEAFLDMYGVPKDEQEAMDDKISSQFFDKETEEPVEKPKKSYFGRLLDFYNKETEEPVEEREESVEEEEEEPIEEEEVIPAVNEKDINEIEKKLKKGENIVYVNLKNSSDISLKPQKGYSKNSLTKKEIIQRMKVFNKSIRSKNNITLKKALNESRSILNNKSIRNAIQGNKSTIQKGMEEEVKEFNKQNTDMSFSEWLGNKYNLEPNSANNKSN